MQAKAATERATGHLAVLKELAIKAIKSHPNYRGKPLNNLPSIIDRLVQNKDYVTLATELEKKQETTEGRNRLADITVSQAKNQSRKDGNPWSFDMAKKIEKKEADKKGRDGPDRRRQPDNRSGGAEELGSWAKVQFRPPEWGSPSTNLLTGQGVVDHPCLLHQDEVQPGKTGLAAMDWVVFKSCLLYTSDAADE